MQNTELRRRARPVLDALRTLALQGRTPVLGLRKKSCPYHSWDTVQEDPATAPGWTPFAPGDAIGGVEAHYCFRGGITAPAGSAGRHLVCLVSTGATDIWNNNNPQFLAYLNGALVCGLDVNHTEFDLSPAAAESQTWQLGLYTYCNTPAQDVFLRVETAVRDDEITGLYYDLKAPYEVLVQLDEGDTNAIGIGRYLEKALDMLDLRNPYSTAFYASVAAARHYMKEEFYESFCQRQPVTVDCVGHTHIDVAWLWTLAQTREKAIRSFASVDYLMERYPEYRGQATLAMVIVPSRDRVNSYADLKTEIDKEIGAINGRYSTMEWTPVRYFYHGFSFEELAAMYYVADVALVTPLRDGMNLVAKEYVAVKNDNPGVLILSEMAGAAVELADALPINPNDTEQIAAAIHRALTMPVEEQLRRIERMQAVVSTQTVNKWAADFMKELADVCRRNEAVRRKRLTSETVAAEIVGPYRRAKRRLLLFDYDGTLAPIRSRPEEAVPSHRLCELLRTLGTDAANRVVICSGRDSGTLEKWFGGLPVSLAAEHGAFYKDRGAWRCNIRPASWDPKLSALLEHFARKTPRSRIERKQTALAWHYREADSWLGQLRAQQLVNALMPLCARLNLHILQGDKVVEIKSPRFTKGSETLRLLRQERYDFILALGDDTTDDDMFAALPPRALSIKIGNASEHARYNMPEQSEVVPLLELLARDRGSFDPAGVKHAIRTTWNNLKKLVAGRRTEEYGQ